MSSSSRAHPGLGRAVVGVIAVPSLWGTALRQAVRLAPAGWWRRAPFLPVPRRDYLRFRLDTQYGSTGAVEPDDLVVYLRWCRDHDR